MKVMSLHRAAMERVRRVARVAGVYLWSTRQSWRGGHKDVRRRLMGHDGRTRERVSEAARCSRTRAWRAFIVHSGWQAWHDRQAHKLCPGLAVLEAEGWLAHTLHDNAGQASAPDRGVDGDRGATVHGELELGQPGAWEREAQQVFWLASLVGVSIDRDELLLQDVRDLVALRTWLASRRSWKRWRPHDPVHRRGQLVLRRVRVSQAHRDPVDRQHAPVSRGASRFTLSYHGTRGDRPLYTLTDRSTGKTWGPYSYAEALRTIETDLNNRSPGPPRGRLPW